MGSEEIMICLKIILPFYCIEHDHMIFEALTVVKMLVLQNVGYVHVPKSTWHYNPEDQHEHDNFPHRRNS
jgi:hypothetical protein